MTGMDHGVIGSYRCRSCERVVQAGAHCGCEDRKAKDRKAACNEAVTRGDMGEVMNENKAIPGWVTADFLTEARRLQGSSRKEPRPKSSVSEQLYHADPNDIEDLWTDMFGEKHTAHPDTCWLTPAGHTALAAIEAEESAPKAHGNWCNEIDKDWAPKLRDCVRVKGGSHFAGLVGIVSRTAEGAHGDLTRVALVGMKYPFEEAWVKTANLEPAPAEVTPRPFIGTETERDGVTDAIAEEMMRYSARVRDAAEDSTFMLPGNLRPGRRNDGHDTGPILTGNARESYLAIHSGAEDPHAAPETVTEPSCGYCKDTGIGELGMDCPVRTCEAVAS